MRCCVCNKKLDKENAYKFAWFNYGSRRYHDKYFCNKEECNRYFEDRTYRYILMNTIGEILGEKYHVSCIVDKNRDELHDEGFSYKEILIAISKERNIFNFNDEELESEKIKYIFDKVNKSLRRRISMNKTFGRN